MQMDTSKGCQMAVMQGSNTIFAKYGFSCLTSLNPALRLQVSTMPFPIVIKSQRPPSGLILADIYKI